MVGLRGLAAAEVARAFTHRTDHLDRQIIDSVAHHRSAWATEVADATMFVGTTPAVLATVCIVGAVVVVVLHAYRVGAVVAVSAVAAIISAELLKSVFERPRPPSALALASTDGYSFPSTQAAETSAIAAGLIVLLVVGPGWGSRLTEVFPRRAQIVVAGTLVVAVGFVGLCMVYLGAHWPSDVFAGWMLGTAIGATVGWVASRIGRGGAPAADERSELRSSATSP